MTGPGEWQAVFGPQGHDALAQREATLLPAPVRPVALRRKWLALTAVLLVLGVLVAALGSRL